MVEVPKEKTSDDTQKVASWRYVVKGHAEHCVERHGELANKCVSQLKQAATPCIDDHHLKKEGVEVVGALTSVRAQIVLSRLYQASTNILRTINTLARTVTNGTKRALRDWQD